MKKSLFIFALATAVLGLQSCSDDTDPKFQVPAPGSFILNTPALQDQYIELTPDGTFELSCSQPDYGFSAVTTYSAEVSLTEDFADFRALEAKGGTEHMARTTYKDADLALAICQLLGYSKDNVVEDIPVQKVYFRAVAVLPNVEGSEIKSNVVSLNYVKPYFAVPTPGYIYFVGAPEGWAGPTEGNAAHYADWRLFEADDAIGSKVYSGVFDIPADKATFRFYTALTGWDADSYGAAGGTNSDTPVEFPDAFAGDSEFNHGLAKTKDSFYFPNWTGGKMTIIVNMSDPDNMTVTMIPGEASVITPKYLYVIGANSGWAAPSLANKSKFTVLTDKSDSGIYVGAMTLDTVPDWFNFRIAMDLYDGDDGDAWGNVNWIGCPEGDNYEIDSNYEGAFDNSQNTWRIMDAQPGQTIQITVDLNSQRIIIEAQ